MIRVRSIKRGEGAVLLAMTRALAVSHGIEEHLTAGPDMLEEAFFAANPVAHCLIAEFDGMPAGCALWHRSFSSFRGREVMFLEDIAVLPEFRRKGIARALMQAIAREAVARGYPSVAWHMMDWNDGARKLYADLGAEIESGVSFCRLHGEALAALAAP